MNAILADKVVKVTDGTKTERRAHFRVICTSESTVFKEFFWSSGTKC